MDHGCSTLSATQFNEASALESVKQSSKMEALF